MGILCLFYRDKLAALASQELPEPLAGRVERHLSACPDCLSEWVAQERMVQSLRQAGPDALAPNPFLWERLEAAIQAEAPRPAPTPLRRLAPMGGMALAGVAAAAIWIARPAPEITPAPPVAPAQVAVAVRTESPKPIPSALELARQSAALTTKPQAAADQTDPFRKRQVERTQSRPRPLPRIVRVARRKQLPELSLRTNHEPLTQPAQRNAVALLEVGMHRVVEESQTEELNRLVAETEQAELGVSQRAACAPTDATAIAQNTRNLFQ